MNLSKTFRTLAAILGLAAWAGFFVGMVGYVILKEWDHAGWYAIFIPAGILLLFISIDKWSDWGKAYIKETYDRNNDGLDPEEIAQMVKETAEELEEFFEWKRQKNLIDFVKQSIIDPPSDYPSDDPSEKHTKDPVEDA